MSLCGRWGMLRLSVSGFLVIYLYVYATLSHFRRCRKFNVVCVCVCVCVDSPSL